MKTRPRVLLITPIAPAPTGNGLAMRAGLLVEGLARCSELTVVVVPVADPGCTEAGLEWVAARAGTAHLVALPTPQNAARGWLASDRGRELAALAEPLPARARLATPALGAEVLRSTGGGFDAVFVLRGYLAGLVAPLHGSTTRPALVLDLDEDDEAALGSIADLHRLRGEEHAAETMRREARACGRLLEHSLPWFDRVLVATELERRRLRARRPSFVLPNAVRIRASADRAGDGRPRLVLIGNLDYLPNRDAAERLIETVFPAVRRELPGAELHLVGAGSCCAAGGGVVQHGAVPELADVYRTATATVVPLRAGGGSRMKILEAFAERVPVVATPEAVEGLGVRAGHELLVESEDRALASAAVRIARDSKLAGALVRAGLSFVRREHDLDATADALASLCQLA